MIRPPFISYRYVILYRSEREQLQSRPSFTSSNAFHDSSASGKHSDKQTKSVRGRGNNVHSNIKQWSCETRGCAVGASEDYESVTRTRSVDSPLKKVLAFLPGIKSWFRRIFTTCSLANRRTLSSRLASGRSLPFSSFLPMTPRFLMICTESVTLYVSILDNLSNRSDRSFRAQGVVLLSWQPVDSNGNAVAFSIRVASIWYCDLSSVCIIWLMFVSSFEGLPGIKCGCWSNSSLLNDTSFSIESACTGWSVSFKAATWSSTPTVNWSHATAKMSKITPSLDPPMFPRLGTCLARFSLSLSLFLSLSHQLSLFLSWLASLIAER